MTTHLRDVGPNGWPVALAAWRISAGGPARRDDRLIPPVRLFAKKAAKVAYDH